MVNEIEAAAGEAVGGLFKFRRRNEHALPPGTPCANCATPLMGPWCHQCGQVGEDFHRSIWKLIGEAFEGLLHFDGRVWTTVPELFLHPARLTRAYLDGHRAPQIPPFRLFLVVLVAVFLAGSLTQGAMFQSSADRAANSRSLDRLTPAERAKLKAAIASGHTDLSIGEGAADWLKARIARVVDDPQRFWLVLEGWGERFAFLALPMAVLLISIAFVFQRRFYVFDHTIFSLHSLSAVGLMFAAAEALSPVFGQDAGIILWGAPVHLFAHLRGVYRTSVIGTLARMAFLFTGSVIIGVVIFLGLLLVGLNGMNG
ncbi:MAG TPA: DUF3667 domain-containing protein [Caulobacteraceae bacterium]